MLGFAQLGRVQAVVFNDLDNDGVWDGNEDALANRTVRLWDRLGKSIIAQGATNEYGRRAFATTFGTEYQLEILLPTGWTATTPKDARGVATTKVKVVGPAPSASLEQQYGQYNTNDRTPPPAPTANPGPGEYTTPQSVSLASETGATIRYTLDGSIPTAVTGSVYNGPIWIGISTKLNAVAIDAAGNVSTLTSTIYSLPPATTAPPAAAATWTRTVGTVRSGSAAQLGADDGAYLVMASAKVGSKLTVDAYGAYTVPQERRNLVSLTVDFDAGASAGGYNRTLSLYNFTTSTWETLETKAQTIPDLRTTIRVGGDPKRFLSSTGELRMRVQATHSSTFDLKVDLMTFTVTYR
jgi:hypothetical protein